MLSGKREHARAMNQTNPGRGRWVHACSLAAASTSRTVATLILRRFSQLPGGQIPIIHQNRKLAVDIGRQSTTHSVVDKLDTTFAVLSDPTRRAMIERLSHGPASVHRLTEPFALSQQMISKHIACLVRARIVFKTKRGREGVCTLRPEAIKAVSDWAIRYRRFWEEIPSHGFTGGENVMQTSNILQWQVAFDWWLTSETHLAQILNRDFAAMGVGVCARIYGVEDTKAYWVVIFSSRMDA
jgi:DNA-binding transcriptional ArsR family regulator